MLSSAFKVDPCRVPEEEAISSMSRVFSAAEIAEVEVDEIRTQSDRKTA
jgi:hypothetical protein